MDDYRWQLTETKYDPGQSRVPAGHQHGGRWTSEGVNPVSDAADGGTETLEGVDNQLEIRRIYDQRAYSAEHWFGGASDADRGELKDRLVSDIAEKSGEDYETINMIIKQWAGSSNGDKMASLALQQDAAEEFGVELSDFTKKRIKQAMESVVHYRREPLYDSETQRRVLRAMYEITQRRLRSMGIGPDQGVTLFRGTTSNQVGEFGGETLVKFDGNAMESWSVSVMAAHEFTQKYHARLITTSVKARNILALATTGFGCLTEAEVVTIDANGTAWIMPEQDIQNEFQAEQEYYGLVGGTP